MVRAQDDRSGGMLLCAPAGGAAAPIVRGSAGERIPVLQGVEVVRGTATLLYGSNAKGPIGSPGVSSLGG